MADRTLSTTVDEENEITKVVARINKDILAQTPPGTPYKDNDAYIADHYKKMIAGWAKQNAQLDEINPLISKWDTLTKEEKATILATAKVE